MLISLLLRWMSLYVFSAATMTVTNSMCWTIVAKTFDSSGIGMVIYQKPTSSECYEKRKVQNPPLCQQDGKNSSWYLYTFVTFPLILVSLQWPNPELLASNPYSV